jgi:hypothetical protein
MSHTLRAVFYIQFVILVEVLLVMEKFPLGNIYVQLVRDSKAVKLNPRGMYIV